MRVSSSSFLLYFSLQGMVPFVAIVPGSQRQRCSWDLPWQQRDVRFGVGWGEEELKETDDGRADLEKTFCLVFSGATR